MKITALHINEAMQHYVVCSLCCILQNAMQPVWLLTSCSGGY